MFLVYYLNIHDRGALSILFCYLFVIVSPYNQTCMVWLYKLNTVYELNWSDIMFVCANKYLIEIRSMNYLAQVVVHYNSRQI